jgi:thiamine-monophosphate kinase
MEKGERAFISWLEERVKVSPLRAPIGLGDDMAAIRIRGSLTLVTADMLVDGVHFQTKEHAPRQIGRKALACSLSDCAAMAVRPAGAVVSVALPNAWSMEQARDLMEGVLALADEFGCALVGGDTNSWDHPLVIDVAVLAQPYPRMRPVRRNGARIGDGIYLSGPLGGSRLGRHLTFTPRIVAARELAVALNADLHAMLDISDGLVIDAARMAQCSGVHYKFDEAALETEAIHPDAQRAAAEDGRTALDHALYDGEDFELLATCARSEPTIDTPGGRWVRIGRVVEPGTSVESTTGGMAAALGGHVLLSRKDGSTTMLEIRGWEHFR